jgi:hypothetical protein
MPYEVRFNDDNKDGEKWETYNPDTGKVYGKHSSKKKAEDQQAALYANADPDEEKKPVYKVRMRKDADQ